MKNLYLKPIVLAILCTLGMYVKSNAQAYGNDHNLTLLTSNPTVNTTVQMGIFFTMPNGCYSAVVTPPFAPATLNGFTIDIPVHTYNSGVPGCTFGLVTINESISLGLLFAGTYTVRLVEYPEGTNPTIVATRTVTVTGNVVCPAIPPIQFSWVTSIIADLSEGCSQGYNPTISTAMLNGNMVIVASPGWITPGGGSNATIYRCNGQEISGCDPLSGCYPLTFLSLTNFNTIWDCNSGGGPNLTHGSSGNVSFNNGSLVASFSVINNGTSAAGASTVCAYLSTSLSNNQNIFLTPSISIPAIQAGSSYNINNHVFDFCNLNIPAGTYYFGFEIDCGDVVAETDESYDDNTGFFGTSTINHSGCGNITITPGSRTVGPLANSCATYTLNSNVAWTLTDNMNWATASPSSGGAGNFTIQVCATSANNSASQRSGQITANGGGATASATFIQSGATLSASPLSFSFPAIGGTATLNITSNTNWSLSSLPGWLSVSPSTGTGNGSVTLTCAQNMNTSPRSGTLTLAGGGQTVSISINQQAAAPIALTVNPTSLNIGNQAGSTTFNITTNCTNWSITNLPSWLTVSPSTGSGNATITVQYQQNTSNQPRSVTLVVSGCSLSQNIVITQAAASLTLTVNPTSLNIGDQAGSATFNVTTNCANWSITNLPSWLTVSPSTGSGNATITVQYQQNTNTQPRSVTLVVSGCSLSQNIVITQAAATLTLTVNPTSLSIGDQAGSATFNITTNCTNWSITNLPSWLTVSPSTGSGNATITVQYQQNTSNQARSVTLVVSGCSLSQNILITQAAASLTLMVNPTSLNIGDQAGSATFNVTTNCTNWSITNLPSWLTVSPSTGSGNATITVQYQQNTSNQPRSVTLVVSGCSLSQNIVITQAAAPITLTLNPASLNIDGEAGSATFNITTNCTNWSISNPPSWLTLSLAQGSGNATITVQYQQNTGDQPRSITLSVSGCSLSQNIVITQAAQPISYPWTPSITGSNHSVILSGNLDATIDDIPIETGDLVGFFYEDGGTLHCSNFVVWQGIATGCPVYGNDNAAGMPKNGFESGEIFKVKVYRTATSEEFIAEAEYAPIATFITHSDAYANDGISMVIGLSASTVATMEIQLNAGWNMISSYVIPTEPNIFDVFSSVWDPVTIVKDGQGNFTVPPINQIGDWSMPKGYQVRAEAPTTLTITGVQADPTTTPIVIVPGWQIISYLRDQPGLADEQLASIAPQIEIVKNNAGAFYHPQSGVNGIINLLPTQGYKVKANAAATLYYPPNFRGGDPDSWSARNPILNPVHFVLDSINTGNNASLIFPSGNATSVFQPDDEIGIFNGTGVLCGAAVAGSESFGITVWGDDPSTPGVQEGMNMLEPYVIRIWRAAEQEESILSVVYQEGDGLYQEDDIEIVEAVDIVSALSPEAADNQTLRVWPNPSSSRFWIQIPASIEWVRFYNAQGQEIHYLNRPQVGALQVDLGSVVSGAVFIQAYGKATYRTAVLNISR